MVYIGATHTHSHTRAQTDTDRDRQTDRQTDPQTYAGTCIDAYPHTYMHAWTPTRTYIMHLDLRSTDTDAYTDTDRDTHTHTGIQKHIHAHAHTCKDGEVCSDTYTYLYMHAYLPTCLHAHTSMFACKYTYMNASHMPTKSRKRSKPVQAGYRSTPAYSKPEPLNPEPRIPNSRKLNLVQRHTEPETLNTELSASSFFSSCQRPAVNRPPGVLAISLNGPWLRHTQKHFDMLEL